MEQKFVLEGEVPAGKRLLRDFFIRDGITVARELLGKVLVHETSLGTVRGVITEVESYMGVEDKGSHSYGGRRTERTEPMFRQGGTSYVYFIYGSYYCMNIVAGREGNPQAVLIRGALAADPQSGRRMEQLRWQALTEKRRRRGLEETPMPPSIRKNPAVGPGRLCIAMEISKKDNAVDMVQSPSFYVTEGLQVDPGRIHAGKRIGIDYAQEAADYLWRFYL